MHVEVPITFTTSPSFTPAPIASQCASNAPTGIGMPGRKPSFAAHSSERLPGNRVRRLVLPAQFAANAFEQRIDRYQKSFGRKSTERLIPHPLVAHRANAARRFRPRCVIPHKTVAT